MSCKRESTTVQKQDGDSVTTPVTSPCGYCLIVPIVFLFYLGIEIIKYSLNEWTQYYIKTSYFPNETFHKNHSVCENKEHSQTVSEDYKKVQQQTSHWLLYFKIAEYVPTMLAVFVLPSYSDAVGRRSMLFIAGFGSLIKAVAVAITIYFKLPLYWILIGYTIEGLCGGSRGYICICYSYVADMTVTNSHRVLAVTVIETTIILTSTIGGFVTGYMVENDTLGYRYTAIICVSLITVSLLFGILFLGESLPREKRTPVKPFLATVKRTFDFCFSREFKGKRKSYILLLLSFAFSELGESNRSGLETLYFLGQPFCWDPIRIGYFSVARHASKGILGIALLPVMQRCLPSEAITLLSSLSNLSSYIIEAFAKSTLVVYMATVSGVFTLLAVPMIRGIMSTMTSSDKQGSVFASIAVIETGSGLITIATQNSVYSATVSGMNGFVFLVMAGFCLIEGLLICLFWWTKPTTEATYERINETEIPP